MRIPIATYPCKHLVLSDYFSISHILMISHLLLNYSLLITDALNISFKILLAIWISSFVKCLLKSVDHFSTLSFSYQFERVPTHIKDTNNSFVKCIKISCILLPCFLLLAFHMYIVFDRLFLWFPFSFTPCFLRNRALNYNVIYFTEKCYIPWGHEDIFLCYLLKVYCSDFYITSETYL